MMIMINICTMVAVPSQTAILYCESEGVYVCVFVVALKTDRMLMN